tara:strand:+ start:377 stop:700 length:324 start_codon:yes stop_codon:yes gene_type:complete
MSHSTHDDNASATIVAEEGDALDQEFALALLNKVKNRAALVSVPDLDQSAVSVLRKRRAQTVRFDSAWEVGYCCTDAPVKVARTKAQKKIRALRLHDSGDGDGALPV